MVSRIGQDKATLQAPLFCFVNQIQRQYDFGLESNLLRNPSVLPADGILYPSFRKIQCPIQRSARFLCPQIQRHRHLTVGCLPQSTTVLPRHSHRVFPLLGKRHFINQPISLRNEFPFHLSGQRSANLAGRPGALVHKLLQGLHISIRKTIRHGLNGLAFPIHQETPNVFLGMMPPVLATHRQNDIRQEGLQLQPKSFYLSGFHTQECTSEYNRMSRIT